jgi:hypothetical protein
MTPTFIVGVVLTVMILSYLIGDNFLFRMAVYILVGAGAAYALVLTIEVLVNRVFHAPDLVGAISAVLGLILSAFLLFKISLRTAWVGNIAVGYLIGVGAAVALGGALFGTLAPQLIATASPADGLAPGLDLGQFLLNLIIVVGTVVTFLSFGYYRAARGGWLSGITTVGRRFFLMVAFGATFALVFIASATLLVGRLEAILQVLPK